MSEEYNILDIVPYERENFKGYCVLIALYKGIQSDVLKVFISEEQRNYLANYNGNVENLFKDCFVLEYNFYKKCYSLTFNNNLLK